MGIDWINNLMNSWTITSQSSQSSFIPGWIGMLLHLKTQHPQSSVHGILFLRHLQFLSPPLLQPHFIRCKTASGAGGFTQRTGEKWFESLPNVQPNAAGSWRLGWSSLAFFQVTDEYVSQVDHKLVGGFLLQLHGLSRRTNEAHLLLCIYTQSVPTEHASEVRSLSFPSIARASRILSSQDMKVEARVFSSAWKSTRHIRTC